MFLNTRVGATPVAATHGTTVDAVQLVTPQTPTAPALEPLPPMDMTALCFDNSTRSAINDIAGLTDGQLPYVLPQTQVLSVTLLNRRFAIISDPFAPSPGAA